MNLNATPETIRAIAEVFKLAAFLDDRVAQADRHRIAAWAEQVQRHRLSDDDLLDGVQAFYDSPSERPIGVGDLIGHARTAKRLRLDREEDAERERRQTEQEAKVADEIAAFTAEAIIGRVKATPRLTAAREALQTCHGKSQCQAAIQEFNAAKHEARKYPAKADA